MPKKKADYGNYLVVMPKNEAHGQVGQLQSGKLGVGQHMVERGQKAEIFWSQYPERYTEGNKHRGAPYNSRHYAELQHFFSELCISNV